MSEIPFGAEAPAGHFRCVDCGQEMWNRATAAIPPCPNLISSPHRRCAYEAIGGLDDLLHEEEEYEMHDGEAYEGRIER
jgi:hypothetical protein